MAMWVENLFIYFKLFYLITYIAFDYFFTFNQEGTGIAVIEVSDMGAKLTNGFGMGTNGSNDVLTDSYC